MKNMIKKVPLRVLLCSLATCIMLIITVSVVRGETICEHTKCITQELAINDYRTEKDTDGNYTKVPTYGDGSEWIFAGWYTDDTCTTAVSSDTTEGTYTAKFVPKHILDVKAQVSTNVTNNNVNDDTMASLRFVTTVDSLKYSKIGFEVVLREGAEPIISASNHVYRQLYGVGDKNEILDYIPEDEFCEMSYYFKACVIKSIPISAYDNKIAVTPFWITQDGTLVKSDEVSKSVRDGISKDQEVTVAIETSENGTVVNDTETYRVGDTVSLSGGNEGYYCYRTTIDEQEANLNTDGTFQFIARKDHNVIREFSERIFKDNANWNTLKQNQGVVYLPNGGDTNDAEEELEFYKQYENLQLTLTVKNDPDGTDSQEQSPRTDVKFVFDDDKYITFGVLRYNDSTVMIQSMGGDNSITGWKGWYEFTAEERDEYNSDKGIDFRIVRIGTEFSLYIGDKLVGHADYAAATGAASVYIRHWGDNGVNLDIPFEIVDQFAALSTKDTYSSDKFYVNTRKDIQATADPFVLDNTSAENENHRYYYMYGTNGDGTNVTNFYCYRSKDMMNWEKIETPILDGETALSEQGITLTDLWAPEVVYDAKTELYYLYFSAKFTQTNASKQAPELHLMVATSTTPDGGFKVVKFERSWSNVAQLQYGEIYKYVLLEPEEYANECCEKYGKSNRTYHSAIDPHPYVDDDGTKYLFWVNSDSADIIFGVQMTDWITPKWNTAKPIVMANYWTMAEAANNNYSSSSTNQVSYELPAVSINEGPYVVKKGDNYYLTFSANAYQDNSYQVVQAVAEGNPLGTYRKLTEEEGGVLLSGVKAGSQEVTGTGHHSFVTVGEQTYIMYHRHIDVETMGDPRYPAIDEVKWVTNKDGLDVMYVNGPTDTIQPAVESYSKYINVADEVQVKGVDNGSYVNDGLLSINKNGNATFMEKIPETSISKTTAFTFDFEYAKAIGAIMIYNSKTEANSFENIAQIELICDEDGETVIHYLKDLAFTDYVTEDGTITYVTPGASAWAEFSDKAVKSVRIIVEVPDGETIGISEIRILAKEYKVTTSGENGTVYLEANKMHIVPEEGYQAVVTINGEEVHYTREESIYVLPSMSAEEQREAIKVTFSAIDADHDVSKYVATIETAYYTTLEGAVSAAENKDTVVLLTSVTIETAMEANKQITITNKGNVTITRGANLIASAQTLNVPARGNVTILGAEGTTFTIDGASTEATSSRFAWVGGTLNLENVTVTNFMSTASGAVVYNAGTVNFISSIVEDNSSTTFGGAILNGKTGILNITDSTFSNNTSSSNGGVVASGAGNENGWDGGTINIDGGSFTDNKGAEGGVICAWSSTITVNGNPKFSNNQATSGSGGVIRTVDTNTTLTMNGGTFSGNSAASYGNAIAMHYGTIQNIAFTTEGISANEIHLFTDNVVLSSDVKNVTVTATEIKIGPSSYATDVAIVSKKNADVTDDAFAAVIAKITVKLDANGRGWFVNEQGYLAQAEAGLASTGKKYASLSEAFAARNTTEDTITLYKDVTWDRIIEGTGKLTITNTADVTITRSSDLIESNTLMISYGGTLTIQGKEGTTLIIDGASTEVAGSRMAWVGGTLTFENVEIKNFKSTATGGIVYNAGTVNFISANVNNNSSTGIGAVVRNANAGVLNCTNSIFSNNTSSSNGGVFASGEWSGGTINIDGGSFTGNKGAEGGVICAWDSTITINGNPTFSNNQATSGSGGAIRSVGAVKLTINGGTFSGNSAISNGGVLYVDSTSAQINIGNCAFANNQASYGNALSVRYGTIQNVTFTADAVSTNEILLAQDSVYMSGDVKNLVVTETEIKVAPSNYVTDVALVTKRSSDVTDDAFAAVIAKITVEPDANGGEWFVNDQGYLVQVEASLASTGKKYASLSEAFDARNTTEDTITVYKDATWDRIIEGTGKLTITNTADVTLTRSSDLIESNTLMISYGGTLTIEGKEGTTLIIDGASTEATGSRMAWVGGTLTFENVEIKNFKSTATGGIVYNAGTVNFISANVNNNSSTGVGAIVRNANAGVLNSTNSTFSNNTSSSNGGVFASGEWSGGTINIDGGSFTGNKAAEGGVICGWDSTVTINGNPTFSNNQATSGSGGAIRAVGTVKLTVNGGTFSGNSATNNAGGAIQSDNANAVINIASGVKFTGNKAKNGGAIFNKGQLTITGAEFTKNSTSEHGGAITNTSSLVINEGTKFTENTSSGHGAVIFNDGSATTTINGGTFSGNTTTNHGGVIAAGWGNSGSITINGGTFSGNKGNQGGVIATWGASVTIKGTPIFEKNIANGNGGAICRAAGSPVITIEGGTFSENSAPNGSGGAVYSTCKLTFNGATFKGNTAKTSGGAIYATGTINAGACTFENNKVGTVGNDITITPSTYAEGTQVVTKAADTVTDAEFAAVTKLMQVTPDSSGGRWLVNESGCLTKATVTLSSNNKDYFTLGEAFAARNTKEDTITLHQNATWDRIVEGTGKLTITNTANVTITRSSDLIASNTQMISFGGTLTIKGIEGTTITIDGNSTGATNSRMAWTNGTLNFENVEIKNFKSIMNGTIVYNAGTVNFTTSTVSNNSSTKQAVVLYNASGATATFTDSTISQNTCTGNEHGGAIWNDKGTVTLTNTNVSKNSTVGNGGAIASSWNGGTIIINGGSFTENQAASGGVICAWSPTTITINENPTFSNNKATGTEGGGVIRTVGAAKLTINGGTFSGNSAPEGKGGAIYIDNANAVIQIASGVQFSGNTASSEGGAIYNKGKLTIQAATFSQNQALNGGAVYNASMLEITGAQFSENSATNGHGGAILNVNGTVTSTDTNFSNNSSTAGNGGAIASRWEGGTITLDGGNFTGNTAKEGGAICVWSPTVFTINGNVSFTNNQAATGGGGAICNAGATVTINVEPTYEGNTAAEEGKENTKGL